MNNLSNNVKILNQQMKIFKSENYSEPSQSSMIKPLPTIFINISILMFIWVLNVFCKMLKYISRIANEMKK